MAHLFEVLRYKPEGRGFQFRWVQWDFLFDLILPVDSASNINEYHACLLRGEGGRCVGLKTLLIV